MKLFKRQDLILVAVIVALAAIAALILRAAPHGKTAEVLLDGEVIYTVSLEKDAEFTVPQLPGVVFEVRDGRAAFIHNDCPDLVCVHTGFIGEAGQTALCLPKRAALKIAGEGADAVV